MSSPLSERNSLNDSAQSAAKEDERVARGGVGELRLEGPGLAREHERGRLLISWSTASSSS